MNVDRILDTLNQFQVSYILIGGMNFLLRHKPVLTYDIDIWIEDSCENRARCEQALAALDAEWGRTDDEWKPVRQHPVGWLEWQPLFCLTSPHGAIDVFRFVAGLGDWSDSYSVALRGMTAGGVDFVGLSDEDMLKCQLALDAGLRNHDRIETLEQAIRRNSQHDE